MYGIKAAVIIAILYLHVFRCFSLELEQCVFRFVTKDKDQVRDEQTASQLALHYLARVRKGQRDHMLPMQSHLTDLSPKISH